MARDSTGRSLPETVSRCVKDVARTVLGSRATEAIGRRYYGWRAKRESRRTLERLENSGLAINFGAGWRPIEGWVNVDIAAAPGIDIVLDVTAELPFPTASADAILAEHLIEHLPREDALRFLTECHRVLEPGGVLRLSTPDGGRYLRSYAGDRAFLERMRAPGEVLDFDVINRLMRWAGEHLWIYDAESLRDLVRRAGFSDVSEAEFGISRSRRMSGVDSPERADESLYVEGSR
jgi:predicted SAM-dependent methyltransferase